VKVASQVDSRSCVRACVHVKVGNCAEVAPRVALATLGRLWCAVHHNLGATFVAAQPNCVPPSTTSQRDAELG